MNKLIPTIVDDFTNDFGNISPPPMTEDAYVKFVEAMLPMNPMRNTCSDYEAIREAARSHYKKGDPLYHAVRLLSFCEHFNGALPEDMALETMRILEANKIARTLMALDPTLEEMKAILGIAEPDPENDTEYDTQEDVDKYEAIYWYASRHYCGQGSNLYIVLSNSPFKPGPIASGPEKSGELVCEYFNKLVWSFGGEMVVPADHEDPHADEDCDTVEQGFAAMLKDMMDFQRKFHEAIASRTQSGFHATAINEHMIPSLRQQLDLMVVRSASLLETFHLYRESEGN